MYEEKKRNKFNRDLPKYEELIDILDSIYYKRYDKDSHFMFRDNSTIWRKSSCIDAYVTEPLWNKLTLEAGLQSKPNKDSKRPYAFHITTGGDWDKFIPILTSYIQEVNSNGTV